ncbi:MAG: cytochrome-c peroxidase [Verrucomicrobiales bacterium]|nr:cytochrome-c peroxidase [Verrucomicrobiales bacterium]
MKANSPLRRRWLCFIDDQILPKYCHALPRAVWRFSSTLAALCLGLAQDGYASGSTSFQTTNAPLVARTREPIRPIPQTISVNPAKVSLGKKLFHDPVLSRDRTVACASCHALDKGGTDQRARSIGVNNSEGPINAPTVFNSAFNFKQFWDGRAETLEDQVDGPTQAALEMGANWEEVLSRLKSSSEYVAAFKQAYPDGIQHKNVKDAIAEFERSLITPNSPFDRYLRGDDKALTDDEKEGYRKFKAYGCITCHQGVNVGGNMFQPLGLLGDYFADRGGETKVDLGRFNVTGKEEDKYTFKVPSLRNVALTGPYFHDASAKTLEEAVATMAKYQLGRELPPKDLEQIVLFLKSLTGEYNGQPLR